MSRIRSGDTRPELLLRRMIHRLGYRFRLHSKSLPGRPDIVFIAMRKVVFVHGCFWHVHSCKNGQVSPLTNRQYWDEKRSRTIERDRQNEKLLLDQGWSILVVWECELRKTPEEVRKNVKTFLGEPQGALSAGG